MTVLKVAKGTTIQMSLTAVQQLNNETQAYANLTTPDSIKFYCRRIGTTSVSTHTGDQIGSTNGWWAEKTMDSTGDYEWVGKITEGSEYLVTIPERVVVVST